MSIDEYLKRLDELEAKATPIATEGAWFAHFVTGDGWTIQNAPRWLFRQVPDNRNGEGDAKFVAALRNAYPALRAEIARLRKIEAAAAEVCQGWIYADEKSEIYARKMDELGQALAGKDGDSKPQINPPQRRRIAGRERWRQILYTIVVTTDNGEDGAALEAEWLSKS